MNTKVIFLVFLATTNYRVIKASLETMLCAEWAHHTHGKGLTCCDHKLLHSGINENTHWDECNSHPKNEKENYTTSMWRIYSCVVAKSLPQSEKTITFTKFADIMTKNYSTTIKKKIIEKVKEAKDGAESKNAYLKDDVKLTDYVKLDKIRAAYFNIEKAACGVKDKVAEEVWNKCNYLEEVSHREGDCCGKTPVPFVDHHKNIFEKFNGSSCSKTMSKKLKDAGLKDKEDINTYLDECKFACYLIEKKIITIDVFSKANSKDEFPTKKIVKLFVPPYLSEALEKVMQDLVQKGLKLDAILADIPNTVLGEKLKVDDLFGCYAYHAIYDLTTHALHKHCHPEDSK